MSVLQKVNVLLSGECKVELKRRNLQAASFRYGVEIERERVREREKDNIPVVLPHDTDSSPHYPAD